MTALVRAILLSIALLAALVLAPYAVLPLQHATAQLHALVRVMP